MAEEKKKKDEKDEEIRRLKEKMKKLEAAKAEEEEEKESEGVAGGLLQNIGKMFGLGGLLKGIEKSPAFKERLKKIDEEIERKFKETPLKRAGEKGPRVHKEFRVRPLAPGKPPIKKEPPPPPKEREVDVFDEKDYVKIIAEIPGVEEEDIKIDLEKDKLTISCDVSERKYEKELILPCVPKGKLSKTYKNGILEVEIKKG